MGGRGVCSDKKKIYFNGGMFKWSRVSVTRMSSLSNENGFLRPARVPYKVLYALLFTLIVVIIVLLLPSELARRGAQTVLDHGSTVIMKEEYSLFEYNQTYPLTTPASKLSQCLPEGGTGPMCS